MKKIILMTCISALTLTFSINTYAKIYKWTDTKGVVHYSATPPASKKKAKEEVKNIESKIRFAAGKHRSSKVAKKEKSTENNQKKEKDETELSPPDKKLLDYCKSQRSNLKSLKNNFRNIWVDQTGKRTKLNQKQRQEKVDYLANRIKQDCAEVKTD